MFLKELLKRHKKYFIPNILFITNHYSCISFNSVSDGNVSSTEPVGRRVNLRHVI